MASYVPSTKAERQTMLESLGLVSTAELYHDVPPAARGGDARPARGQK